MTDVRIGIQTGNFQRVGPGTIASQVISDNTIETEIGYIPQLVQWHGFILCAG